MPRAEAVLWQYLRSRKIHGKKFRRQYGILGYTLDFYCTDVRLAIEIDGDTHQTDNEIAHDRKREQFLHGIGIRVLRFTNDEVYEDLERVLETIERNTTPTSSPL